jgi:beta-glucosidase
MSIDRRSLVFAASAVTCLASAAPASRAATTSGAFPKGFLWGAATSGHQTEGANTNSDSWAVEHLAHSPFTQSSGDACDSYHHWPSDLDLVRELGLNTYRFSLEWSRIEPARGEFSRAALDHYKRMIAGCRERGLTPLVTFNHFTCPRWFAQLGSWTSPEAPALFERYCQVTAKHLAADVGYAMTFNEPNLMRLLRRKLPAQVFAGNDAVMAEAAKAYGSSQFVSLFIENSAQTEAMLPIMIEAHKRGRAAIKAHRPDLPVGLTLAIEDDQALDDPAARDAKRAYAYGAWLDVAKGDDFVGVQNYERSRFDAKGALPPPEGAPKNQNGGEIYPASLANAVRFAHAASGVPVLVSEHGVAVEDDQLRAAFVPAALGELRKAIADGVPVLGYVHWSLLDNFEWVFGFGPKFGLASVDRETFSRTAKPSARVLGAIARANGL